MVRKYRPSRHIPKDPTPARVEAFKVKEQLLMLTAGGMTTHQIAEEMGISVRSLYDVKKRCLSHFTDFKAQLKKARYIGQKLRMAGEVKPIQSCVTKEVVLIVDEPKVPAAVEKPKVVVIPDKVKVPKPNLSPWGHVLPPRRDDFGNIIE